MARFTIKGQEVACPHCGKTDFFHHGDRLLTCNGCGYVTRAVDDPQLMIEQVVTKYNS